MIKLYRARSPVYRRQILQENIRWKALDEIYKIYILLHRSDLNIPAKFRHFGGRACATLEMLKKVYLFFQFSSRCSLILMKFTRIFSDLIENAEKRCNSYFSKFFDFNLIFIMIPPEIDLIFD